MKELDFLRKTKRKGVISKVDVSRNISESYNKKSDNCMKSAKLLLEAGLYENSVSESYYAMYNMLLSLLFRCGIKSENHTSSIIILKEVFGLDNGTIKEAKKERIDKQYYVIEQGNEELTKEAATKMIHISENFMNETEAYMMELDEEKIKEIRQKFDNI
ncbi:MAG: HEPN domain-containing protein [Bacteroidota bacterium]